MARSSSDGITFGIVAKVTLGGLGSEPSKPSHSSVTMKVILKSARLMAISLQRFIMGLMWPRPG